jgi:hypothetical protein
MRERELHDQFEAWLKKHRIPYGHDRMDKKTTTKTGEPDFRCYKNGMVAFIEFKIGINKLSAKQVERCNELAEAGCTVKVCYNLESAIAWAEQVLNKVAQPVEALLPCNAPEARDQLYLAQSHALGTVVIAWNNHINDWGCVRLATELDKRTLGPLPNRPVPA